MKLRQLEQFVSLAETGNFRRAAEQLHMAQPPLSVSMRKLEQELDCALFERHPGGVKLTAPGQALLAPARQALQQIERCRQAVFDARDGLGGVVRLGIIGSATYVLLPRLMPLLRQQLPKLRLELSEATTAEILDGLQTRRFDAGLLRYPLLNPGTCALLPLERDEFVLAVAEDNALAQRERIALNEAAQQPFIMYPKAQVPGLAALARLRCQHSGFVPQVAQEAMQVQTILSLVAAGLGVGLVAGVSRHLVPPGVRCLSLSDNPPGLHLGIALAYVPEQASPVLQRLVQTLGQVSPAT